MRSPKSLTVLFSAREGLWDAYRDPLSSGLASAGIDAHLTRDADPRDVDYIVYAPNDTLTDFTPYVACKAVLSLWAGVEKIAPNASLTQPLCRMVDEGLALGMRDYVVGHVMRYHLDLDRYVRGLEGNWDQTVPPLARDRCVGVLGLGALGSSCAQAVSALGFETLGWSRRPKALEGVTTLSGDDGLTDLLTRAQIVITLLPDTPATRDLLNAQRLALMPKGVRIINPGRGTLIDDDALIAALDRGDVGHATLDVFRQEPLPKSHPYWHHPRVTVTPHIAAETRAQTASDVIIENIVRSEAGQPLLHLVDRELGY